MSRGIRADEQFDIIYRGWAPCLHGKADESQVQAWLEQIIRDNNDDDDEMHIDLTRYLTAHPLHGGLEGGLAWAICLLGGNPTLYGDMWVAVTTRGQMYGKTIYTDIQADYPLLAYTETYRWWRDKARELRAEYDRGQATDAQRELPTNIGQTSPSKEAGLAADDHSIEDVRRTE